MCCVAAEHVVREKDDIQQAMKFLQHCDLVRIEDILPFFSDFVTIDHFKEAICNSLQVCVKTNSEYMQSDFKLNFYILTAGSYFKNIPYF